MKIKPLCGFCVIKPLEQEETTKSGIIIPDTATKEKPQEGEVVAIADKNITLKGAELPIEIKVGDKVLYPRYHGEDVKVDGVEYKILEISHVRAIIQ